VTTRRILATSGGFLRPASGHENARRPAGLFRELLRLTGKERPRVLFLMTASGDDATQLVRLYQACRDLSVDADHLALHPYPNQPVDEAFGGADAVWVWGGSVANLLALWRVHGVDDAARDAWERGVILGGVSAGSICWHVGGATDSFGLELRLVTGGLGLLPYGNGVHYDSEAQRRPLMQRLVASGELPLSYCTDDRVGMLYEGSDPVAVLTDEDLDPARGPAAYRLEREGDRVRETRLAPGPLH
jgi:peptidase E